MSDVASTAHDSWARHYDFVNEQSFGLFLAAMTEMTLDLVEELIADGGRITDFGAGTGRLALPLARLGYHVTAVEPSSAMVEELRTKAKSTGVGLEIRESRLQDFVPVERGHLALAVFTVLAYLLDREVLVCAASVMRASVKEGGCALIDVASPRLFGSIRYRTQVLDRRVTVTATEGECYRYEEVCSGRMADESFDYADTFFIRAWNPAEVVEVFEECGWKLHQDVSDRFQGSGSNYFLMRAVI